MRNLEPHTHYRVRVRAFIDEEGGEWSEPSDWLQTPDAARVYELAGRSKVRAADGTSHARTAVDYRPALANDPDYVQGAAVGGLGVSGWNSAENDGDGGGGLVVIAAYTGLAAHPDTAQPPGLLRFARGPDVRRAVPTFGAARGATRDRQGLGRWGRRRGGRARRAEQTSRATESQTDYIQRDRFWGRGGGGGFARASLSVTPGDALEILVGWRRRRRKRQTRERVAGTAARVEARASGAAAAAAACPW